MLDIYIKHVKPGTSIHTYLKLTQQQLQLPLGNGELQSLRQHFEEQAISASRLEFLDEAIVRQAFEPILKHYGEEQSDAELEPGHHTEDNNINPPVRQKLEQKQVLEDLIESLLPQANQDIEQKLASKYRQYLNSQHREAEKVQHKLLRHINETIEENKQFGDMLKSVNNGLLEAESIEEVSLLRRCIIEDVSKLSDAHGGLIKKLDEAKSYLKMIENDSRNLSDELARVRLLSMTDELTELPNRRAFMRRLEDEIGRSQRYNIPLSLAMIDLDSFKVINDRYGHAAGDEVLCVYAENILTVFRLHDLVSRYGGEEFAVILPNTEIGGAIAALEKAKELAANTICDVNGMQFNLPTFSAGVAVFRRTDTAESFIHRADTAMYRAKKLGRNRIETDDALSVKDAPIT